MGGVTADEDIVQDIVEVVEEETQEEEGNEMSDETVTKPTTEEVRKAIDTLVNFSMFTQSGEIGRVALNASNLFEKKLSKSLKFLKNNKTIVFAAFNVAAKTINIPIKHVRDIA